MREGEIAGSLKRCEFSQTAFLAQWNLQTFRNIIKCFFKIFGSRDSNFFISNMFNFFSNLNSGF